MKLFISLTCLCFLICCTTAKKTGSAEILEIREDEISEGKRLVSQSDCFTCHKEADYLIGPGFRQVAKKYLPVSSNIEKLSIKILSGGKGVWRDLPMTPHPNLNKSEAELIVKYILSLSKLK